MNLFMTMSFNECENWISFPRSTSWFCESSQVNTCKCRIWKWMPTLYFHKRKVKKSLELWALAEILPSPSFRVEPTPRRHLPSHLQVNVRAFPFRRSTLECWCEREKCCALQRTSGNQSECAWFPASLSPSSALSATASDLPSLLLAVSSAPSIGIVLVDRMEVFHPDFHQSRPGAPLPQLELLLD